MRNIYFRLLVFFVGIPFLLAVIIFLPYYKHLAFNILTLAASVIGAIETAHFFSSRGMAVHKFFAPAAGAIVTITTYFEVAGVLPRDSVFIAVLSLGSAVLLFQVSTRKEQGFSDILPRVATSITVLFYPSLFFSYIVRLSEFRHATYFIICFLVSVFLNDAGAWLFGMLWGKRSRNVIAVSPNKSIIGFVGGFIGSFIGILGTYFLFPFLFKTGILPLILLAFGIGIATILGDLIESAMKRSSGLKDSGNIIPGRGGLLDSSDSLLLSAPLFYYVLLLIAR